MYNGGERGREETRCVSYHRTIILRRLSSIPNKVGTRCRNPPHKRLFDRFSSTFMRLAEHFTALRAWCNVRLVGEHPTWSVPALQEYDGSMMIRLRPGMPTSTPPHHLPPPARENGDYIPILGDTGNQILTLALPERTSCIIDVNGDVPKQRDFNSSRPRSPFRYSLPSAAGMSRGYAKIGGQGRPRDGDSPKPEQAFSCLLYTSPSPRD